MWEGLQARFLLTAVNDPALRQVVGRQFNGHLVTGKDTNVIFSHLARNMSSHNVAIFEFYSKCRVRKSLGNDTFHLNGFFFGQGLRFSLLKRPANCAEMVSLMQRNGSLFFQYL